MGFLDSLLGKEKDDASASKDAPEYTPKVTAIPFKVSMSFSPLRMTANKSNSVIMLVKVTNLTNDSQMVSVDALLPRGRLIGFDPTCINKHTEKKIGTMTPGETKEVSIPVWGNNQTPSGVCPIGVRVYAHYQTYEKVLSYVKHRTSLRIV